MKNILRVLLLTMIVCCWSCSGGKDDPINPTPKPEEKPKIEVTTTAPVLAQEGGTTSVTFTSSTDWTIDVNEGRTVSWCTVSPTSGSKGTNTLTVTTTSNDTYDERNAKVTIKAGATSQSFTVTQKQKDGLTVTSNKVEIGSDGGNFSIETKANVSVTYEIEESSKDWISASESRGLTTKTLNFTAKANDKTERRQGNIVLKGGDGLTETVTVYQAGEEVSLVLTTEKDMTIGSEGGNLKIELQSNSEIKMEALEADWLRQSSSRSMSAYTYYLEVDANDTYDERNTSITFTSGDKKQIVTVTQKQKDALIVTSNKVEIYSDGGDFTIEAKSNVSVTYEIEESVKDWISASESRGLTTKTLNFTAKANESTERRQGDIILKGGNGLTETVTIYQEGEKPTLVITSDDIIVGSDGDIIKIELKSNVDYTMSMPDVDWISKEESRAISTYTHYLTVSQNESYDQRSAKVFFQNEAEGLKDSISITQLQLDAIIVAKNKYEVAPEGGQLEFKVSSNVDFQVSTSVDWIKQNTGSRGLSEKALSFTIEENEAKESRSGEIIVAYGELKQTIKVNQQEAPDYEAIERAALVEFYKAAAGEEWLDKTNWCSDKPLGEWYGIKTNEKGRVISVNISYNGEKGDIAKILPPLASLKELTKLALGSNGTNIYGILPSDINALTKLEYLDLMVWLEGKLTSEFTRLKNLKRIELRGVEVSEAIFKEMCCSLTNLQYLALDGCNMNSPIPSEIDNLKKIGYLYLYDANLCGEIPDAIWNLRSLRILGLSGNHNLSGTISPKIKNLKNLGSFFCQWCSLTGSIPKEICECSSLTAIQLEGNKLTGNIPENIGNLLNLRFLILYDNNLTGNLPVSMSRLENLEVCELYENRLSGEVPEEVSNMWQIWDPFTMILPQQEGYKLTTKALYSSTDYSKDGEVQLLQKHTEGNGIPVVLLGDAFIDKDMESEGFYERTMQRAMEAYFSIEPMTSLRPLFDVYSIKCVSENNYLGANTALSSSYCDSSIGEEVDITLNKCTKYASLALEDLKDVQIKVIINNQQQLGLTWYLGDGCTLTYNTLFDRGLEWQNFEAVFRHETGHGLGFLEDEYDGHLLPIYEETKERIRSEQMLGQWLNVDFTQNPSEVLWSKFILDQRYKNEDLGIYEGAVGFTHGVYRPSFNSIMRYNEPIFNAPSREAIYKRAMKLAYGENWKYDYEEFVKFDEKSRNAASRAVFKPLTEEEQKEYIKNHRPPRFIKGTWRDAMNKRKRDIVVPLR